ncbi:hypothetical protein EST38_g11945, partial [Candolleomyces aberdarensis]
AYARPRYPHFQHQQRQPSYYPPQGYSAQADYYGEYDYGYDYDYNEGHRYDYPYQQEDYSPEQHHRHPPAPSD